MNPAALAMNVENSMENWKVICQALRNRELARLLERDVANMREMLHSPSLAHVFVWELAKRNEPRLPATCEKMAHHDSKFKVLSSLDVTLSYDHYQAQNWIPRRWDYLFVPFAPLRFRRSLFPLLRASRPFRKLITTTSMNMHLRKDILRAHRSLVAALLMSPFLRHQRLESSHTSRHRLAQHLSR